jgi:hypothetical protein
LATTAGVLSFGAALGSTGRLFVPFGRDAMPFGCPPMIFDIACIAARSQLVEVRGFFMNRRSAQVCFRRCQVRLDCAKPGLLCPRLSRVDVLAAQLRTGDHTRPKFFEFLSPLLQGIARFIDHRAASRLMIVGSRSHVGRRINRIRRAGLLKQPHPMLATLGKPPSRFTDLAVRRSTTVNVAWL